MPSFRAASSRVRVELMASMIDVVFALPKPPTAGHDVWKASQEPLAFEPRRDA